MHSSGLKPGSKTYEGPLSFLQGILFFELFNPVMSATERMQALSGLRHRILPLNLLKNRPQEAAFMTSLLHPDPGARPSAQKLMQPRTLEALQRSICRSVVSVSPLLALLSSLSFPVLNSMQAPIFCHYKALLVHCLLAGLQTVEFAHDIHSLYPVSTGTNEL